MWRSNKYKAIAVVLVILIVYLGFVRDFIFININYIIDELYFNRDVEQYHSIYSFLIPLGVSGLMKLKWFLTFLFMVLNLGLSYFILKFLFSEAKKPIRLLFYGYLGLFLISALFFVGGKLLSFSELGYTLSRRFMGVLQSPVPLMVVATVHLLFTASSEE